MSTSQNAEKISRYAEEIRAKVESAAANDKIDIAIVGQPGAGKSSLINAIRGKPGLAQVGVENDITTSSRAFDWNGTNLTDTPGYGTKSFPTTNFVKKFVGKNIDILILVLSEKLRDDDIDIYSHLSDELQFRLVVKNKIDSDRLPGVSGEELRARIRSNILRQLGEDTAVICTSCDTGEGLDELLDILNNYALQIEKFRYQKITSELVRELTLKKRFACAQSIISSGLSPNPGVIRNAMQRIRNEFCIDDDQIHDIAEFYDGERNVKDDESKTIGANFAAGIMNKLSRNLMVALTVAEAVAEPGRIIGALSGYMDTCANLLRDELFIKVKT